MTENEEALTKDLEIVERLIIGGDLSAALTIIVKAGRGTLLPRAAKRIAELESALVERLSVELPPAKAPALSRPRHEVLDLELTPAQEFLAQVIDSSWDIKSLLWVAPMRRAETLVALKELLDKDLVELLDGPA